MTDKHMVEEARCLKCGSPLTRDAREGICPRCLLSQALAYDDTTVCTNPMELPRPASEPAEVPGMVIGRYKLLEKLGEGGCGVVYMAEQAEPVRRLVALKIVKLGMDTKELVARFEAERQALALMDHPNIAKVFDAGATGCVGSDDAAGRAGSQISNLRSQIPQGRPYFVMELVRGSPITRFCDENKLATRDRLELFGKVCQAIQHAHQKGVIHRDIKPSNVLVTLENAGQPHASAVPKVIDFGIAKAIQGRLTDRTFFTVFEQFVGTPAYMSPEQAAPSGWDVDTRTDIYSLGVLLYELLTGETPFDAKQLMSSGLEAMRKIIREIEPPRPSTRLRLAGSLPSDVSQSKIKNPPFARPSSPDGLRRTGRASEGRQNSKIPLDLDWIVMKCLEKDRARRYETANSLAMDIERHLRLEPVLASPPSRIYRLQKFARRNRTAVAAAAAVAAAVILGAAASAWQWREAVTARRGEEWHRKVAETNAWERRDQLVRLDVANGTRAMDNQDWFGALLWFTEALRQDARDAGSATPVGAPGTLLASAMDRAQDSAATETMHRYRIGSLLHYAPRLTQLWSMQGLVRHAVFSPDSQLALTTSDDRTARLWDVASGKPGPVLRHETNVVQVTFSADGRRVLTLDADGAAQIWDVTTGQRDYPAIKAGYRIDRVLLSPDASRLFTIGDPTETNMSQRASMPLLNRTRTVEVCFWDVAAGRQVCPPLQGRRGTDEVFALSPDGQWLASSFGDALLVWNLRQPHAIRFLGGDEPLATILPARDEPGSDAIEARLPGVPPGRRPSPAWKTSAVVSCLSFSADSQRFVVARTDGSVHLWTLPVASTVAPGAGHAASMPLAGATLSSPLVLARTKASAPFTRRDASSTQEFREAVFSPDGRRVFLVDHEGAVQLWNARTGQAEGQLKGHAGHPFTVSPDGRLALLENQVWDLVMDTAATPRPLHFGLRCAAFSPDGGKLLTGDGDGTVRLWSLANGQVTTFKHNQPGQVSQPAELETSAAPLVAEGTGMATTPWMQAARYSPDGRRILTVSDQWARVWEADLGKAITPYVTLRCPLEYAAFSPDGTRFVTVGFQLPDGAVACVWDAQTGRALTPVMRTTTPWIGVEAEFSPDGFWVMLKTDDKTQLWDARHGQPVDLPLKLDGVLRSLAFSADKRFVAACCRTSATPAGATPSGPYQTRVWNLQTGQPVSPLMEETNEVTALKFSPDGHWLLTLSRAPLEPVTKQRASYAIATRLWQADTGRLVSSSLAAHELSELTKFSRDGRFLYLPGINEPQIWDLREERALPTAAWRGLKLGPSDITSDFRRVVVCRGREVWVYDVLTAELLTPALIQDREMDPVTARFSPDDTMVLASGGGRALLWRLPLETRPVQDLVRLAQLLASRQIDTFGNDVAWGRSQEVARVWEFVRAKPGVGDAVALEQDRTWRERMADTSEKLGCWPAALLHLGQLAKRYPQEESLQVRLARARDQQALQELQ